MTDRRMVLSSESFDYCCGAEEDYEPGEYIHPVLNDEEAEWNEDGATVRYGYFMGELPDIIQE